MPDYIPSTTIKLLADVPFDNTYSDTINFQSVAEQTAFMSAKAVRTFSNNTYQRVNNQVPGGRPALTVRVPEVADNLYNVNYLMFQNENFGSKWFYAFVTQVNYINPNNTEIVYELDHYQTWLFDFTVLPSFVEREHVVDDGLYKNLIPERVGNPDMYCQKYEEWDMNAESNYIVVASVTDKDGKVQPGQITSSIYSGVKLNAFTTAEEANAYIKEFEDGKLDAIVSVFMCSFNPLSPLPPIPRPVERPSSLNGYVPRNNKLLTYPFVKLVVTNKEGQETEFSYENFVSWNMGAPTIYQPQFMTIQMGGPSPKCFCFPVQYGGVASSNMASNKVLTIDPTLPCQFTGNVFANWLNSQGVANALKISVGSLSTSARNYVGAAEAIGSFLVSGNLSGVASAAAAPIKNMINTAEQSANLGIEIWTRSKNPADSRGTLAPPDLNISMKQVGFGVKHMAITPEMAMSIDQYFDMFGYAVNKVKVPNMTGRESWNYVKTNDVIISGSMPVESMSRIKKMFNDGVRFWHGDFVGNYSLSNKIIGGDAT